MLLRLLAPGAQFIWGLSASKSMLWVKKQLDVNEASALAKLLADLETELGSAK